MKSVVNSSLKPWYSARWDTVEPEEPVYADREDCYDEPSVNESLDYEDMYGGYRSW